MEPIHQSTIPGGVPDLYPVVSRGTICAVIADVAGANGLGDHLPSLVRQCERESSYHVAAHNRASDAYGLFQLLRPTAEWLKVNRYDWRDNIVGGVKYMAWLLKLFHGDYAKALAGFNWGQGNVLKAVKAHGDAWRANLPKETSDYLAFILQDGA